MGISHTFSRRIRGSMKRSFRPLLLLLMALSVFMTLAVPAWAGDLPAPPANSAKGVYMFNPNDGKVLFSQNPDMELPMASTTKMMTALLIIEDGHNMNDKVTCSQRCATIGESSIYLQQGESLTVQQMLNGLLLPSGNDAAIALAEYDAGSVEAFVGKMNRRAAELGMTHTHFVTPHGLDEPGHYTSARDFAILGAEVMKHQQLREIVKREEYRIPGYGQPDGRDLINTNHLLKYPYVDGIKTGYTDNAGECIVISAQQNGVSLIIVYLGGPSLAQRDQEVYNLIQYGFASYASRTVVTAGKEYASVSVPYSRNRKLSLVAQGDLSQQVYIKDSVDYRLVLPNEPALPIRKGDKVGMVEAYDGDRLLGSAYLVAASDVPAPGLADRVGYYISSIFHIFGATSFRLAAGLARVMPEVTRG